MAAVSVVLLVAGLLIGVVGLVGWLLAGVARPGRVARARLAAQRAAVPAGHRLTVGGGMYGTTAEYVRVPSGDRGWV